MTVFSQSKDLNCGFLDNDTLQVVTNILQELRAKIGGSSSVIIVTTYESREHRKRPQFKKIE
jgi:hypothetical protein